MAGLFMFLAFHRGLLGLLGFDLGSQSCIPSLPLLPLLLLLLLLLLLPSELHLGFHLGSLCFHLSSIWDSILGHLVSILEFLPDDSGKAFLSTSDTQIVQT